MTKQFRVLCMVVFSLVICTGTVSAYNGEQKEVRVIDLDFDKEYKTSTETVGEFLSEIGITVKEQDTISMDFSDVLRDSNTIEIKRAFPVLLEIDGVPRMVYTSQTTVGAVLKENKDDLGTKYRLEGVSESTRVSEKMTISIISQKEILAVETQEIPFETTKVENDQLTKGFEQVTQKGVNGQIQITLKNIYEGTSIVDSVEAGRVTIQQPVNEVIAVGTKDEVPTIDGYAYASAITVTATGYTQFDEGCTNTTATGTPAVRGVVAIDPSVFKYGTKFYIPGYGVAVAEDCGGAIKGNKIDLCYETKAEAFAWGRRTLTVYILE